MIAASRIPDTLHAWFEHHLGIRLSDLGPDPIPVVETESQDKPPLVAVKVIDRGAVGARSDWVVGLQSTVDGVPMDMLFSPFGCAELARVTLPDGYGIWGPTWYLFGDSGSVSPYADCRPRRYDPDQLRDIDYDLFWHCSQEAVVGFGIEEKGDLVALSVVTDRGGPVSEIGMDVLPDAKARGLGRAVVSAAVNWIVDQGRYAMATVGSFNIPSARTLRSCGLRYTFKTLVAMPEPFKIPPQPLGSPLPSTEVHDYYPRWAMNQNVRPRL